MEENEGCSTCRWCPDRGCIFEYKEEVCTHWEPEDSHTFSCLRITEETKITDKSW